MRLAAALILALLAGCSTFYVGAICYLPAGNAGKCETAPAK